MIAPGRVTRKTAASISFGLGSFILMADITVVVLTRGEGGGNVFDMGFPTPLGIAGLMLWLAGAALVISHRISSRSKKQKDSIRPIFLHGRPSFRCPVCGKSTDTSRISFHRRYKCQCGSIYDLYQEPDEER
jgi:hypothetical protein